MLEYVRDLGYGYEGYVELIRYRSDGADPNNVTWITKPNDGQMIVKKTSRRWKTNSQSSQLLKDEGEGLLALQPHFTDEQSRPVRILGRGHVRFFRNFLLVEHIDDPFQSLGSLVGNIGMLSLSQTLSIVSETAGVLAKSHRLGIVHGDLEEDGSMHHIFVHPLSSTDSRIRLIDWEGISRLTKPSFDHDVQSMGGLLFRLLTGHYIIQPEVSLLREELRALPEGVQYIIKKSGCLVGKDPSVFRGEYYPSTSDGMQVLYQDIEKLKVQTLSARVQNFLGKLFRLKR